MKKKLLIFAHRGEAKAFLSHFEFKALCTMEGLYESNENFLLITGEGPWKAGPKLGLVLGILKEKISVCLNLGIAGGLKNSLDLNQIYPIRTVFLEQNGELQFQSHQLNSKGEDLITCHKRVLTKSDRLQLDSFGSLVDRELWALAQTCQQAKLPLQAFKMISDLENENEICTRIKEQSAFFSQTLLDFYLGLEDPCISESSSQDYSWDGFYFTKSMSNQRDKLLASLQIKLKDKEDILERIGFLKLLDLDIKPKERGIILLENMRAILNPGRAQLMNQLNDATKGFSTIGASIKFNQDLETPLFHLAMTITSPRDLERLKEAISKFNYRRVENIFEGRELDV